MSIKNFKGFKNYQKRAPHPTKIEILNKEGPQMKFQKERIKPLFFKALPTIVGMIGGYLLIDLPGIILGGVASHQLMKLFTQWLSKNKQKKSLR